MPTYEYRCTNCKHQFEVFQSMKDAPKRKCPECGKNTLERLIGTGAAVLFKGAGFYQTDYRSESYKKSASAETGDKSKPDTTPGSKPEAKPESKPAPSDDKPSTAKKVPNKK